MPSRRLSWVYALPLLVILSGCHLRQMTDLAEDPLPDPLVSPMTVGEVREFTIPADGEWHATTILAMKEDLMLIEPLGATGGLEDGALQCRVGVGSPELWVDPKQSIRFPRLAPLDLRVISKEAAYLPNGKAVVRITKRDEKIIR